MHKDTTYTPKKTMSYTNIESHESKTTTENKEKTQNVSKRIVFLIFIDDVNLHSELGLWVDRCPDVSPVC